MTCTPAWRRVGVQMLNDQATGYLVFSKRMQEKYGGNPDLPSDAIVSLERGEIAIDHDPDYVKAQYTRQLVQCALTVYHQDWEIIENDTAHPFITSDNPVAIRPSSDFRLPPVRFVPITPHLALSFRATKLKSPPVDPTLAPPGHLNRSSAHTGAAKAINKAIVMCAEQLVLSAYRSDGLASLVAKCARFRVETEYVEIPAPEPDAIYQGTIIRVREARQCQTPTSSHSRKSPSQMA
jgi:hypothetical protein